jgi:glycine/D-amino acid oxidase-like deaminating enzyme
MKCMPDLPNDAQVVIVGAGLAGLAAAHRLQAAGLQVVVLEAGNAPGGRVRTDRRDGLLLDRGFQLFNPAYPAARIFDIDRLDLRPFRAGVIVTLGEQSYRLGDPRRWPAAALSSLRAPVGSIWQKLRFARWIIEVGARPAHRILDGPDRTLAQELSRRGLDGRIGRTVIRPFLAGVLGEESMTTSARFANMIIRSLVRGTPSLPSRGMQVLPEQLATRLGPGALRLNTTVTEVREGMVVSDRGNVRAPAIIVAADPRTACRLTGLPTPEMRSLTTFYHLASTRPTRERVLFIDGERRGPLVNSVVVSNAAPSYSQNGALIASTVLGADDSPEMEALIREQAGTMYGVESRRWEHVATYAIRDALPALSAPLELQRSVALGDGLYIAGDHRDTASIQGALVSGRRAAGAVLEQFGTPDGDPSPEATPPITTRINRHTRRALEQLAHNGVRRR